MARIVYGGLVSDISGSIGGSTLQRSQFGPVIRNKPRPLRNTSQSQLETRALMSQVQYAWRNLSAANRFLWNNFNSFSLQAIRRSQSVAISGYALFIKYNFLRLLNGGSILTTFTYTPMPVVVQSWVFFSDAGDPIGITDDGAAVYDNIFSSIRVSPKRPDHLAWTPRNLRFAPADSALGIGCELTAWGPQTFGQSYEVGDVVHVEITLCSTLSPIIMRPSRIILTCEAS
jgi:hypothetical protein